MTTTSPSENDSTKSSPILDRRHLRISTSTSSEVETLKVILHNSRIFRDRTLKKLDSITGDTNQQQFASRTGLTLRNVEIKQMERELAALIQDLPVQDS